MQKKAEKRKQKAEARKISAGGLPNTENSEKKRPNISEQKVAADLGSLYI